MGGNERNSHHPLAAGNFPCLWTEEAQRLTRYLASSGAAATIASDALMNPFDGKADTAIICLD